MITRRLLAGDLLACDTSARIFQRAMSDMIERGVFMSIPREPGNRWHIGTEHRHGARSGVTGMAFNGSRVYHGRVYAPTLMHGGLRTECLLRQLDTPLSDSELAESTTMLA